MTGLITIGDKLFPAKIIPKKTIVFKSSIGYDGQFYYIMAHDPLILTKMYQYLDAPAYRYQRMLYPLLVYGLSCGIPDLIPFMLILVNLAAIIMGTYFVALMLKDRKMNPWYALFYTFLSGFLFTILRDLSGPLAAGFVVGGLFFYYRQNFIISALFISASVLTREIFLAVVPILAFDEIFLKRNLKAGLFSLIPLVPFLLWQFYVYYKIQTLTWQPGRLGIPFMGIITNLEKAIGTPHWISYKVSYLLIFVMVCIISLVLAIQEIFLSLNETTICFLLFSLMPFLMTEIMWVEPWAYSRVFLPSAVFLVLTFVKSGDKAYLLPLCLHGVMFMLALKWLYII